MRPPGASLRPASLADFRRFYGHAPPRRTRALAVEDADGRLLGIGGVEHHGDVLKAFMDMHPDVDPEQHRRTLVRAVRRVLKQAEGTGLRIVAVRDQGQPRSQNFLNHFGFAPFGAADQQEIWRWRHS